ncbi:NAD(P)-binding protein [Pseudomonadales bacterium]|nr:NAD(P)-binding protein [Pseudomonadales bacterium]
MSKKITRRDLLNGLALGTGAALTGYPSVNWALAPSVAGQRIMDAPSASAYPPTLTGMRGSHPGSFEVAHALAWQSEKPATYEALGEHYDLVVVGAGMSGLAAAWYYQKQQGADVKILLLDNHDDFGGHAKRNEFHHQGKMVLSTGGAVQVDTLSGYSEMATQLMADLGIDEDMIEAMQRQTPTDYLLGGQMQADVGLSIKGEGEHEHVTIGGHWLKFFHGRGDYVSAVEALPIPEDQQAKLIAFFGGDEDYLDDFSLFDKWEYINETRYNHFLIDRVGLTRETLPILGAHLSVLNGPSGWQHTVYEAILAGAPGLRALGWVTNFIDSAAAAVLDDVSEIRMFPDGNASVARLLVQALIPEVAPAMDGISDVAIAQFDYDALDEAKQNIRVRLSSTVVGVKEMTDEKVQVDYVKNGEPLRVTANHCVLACYNAMIPHLCPEMSDAQKQGLSYGEKVPFVFANVLLADGVAFSQLGLTITQCPFDAFQWVVAGPTMTTGGYAPPRTAADPMVVFMMGSPTPADDETSAARDLFRRGRHKIYATTFAEYEQNIRDQLQSLLGGYGFDHETDIQAITVNRIPHGYAYWYWGLDDPEWSPGQAPHEIGRKQFGRISIANSDSQARPYMDGAFDAAFLAVDEQIA